MRVLSFIALILVLPGARADDLDAWFKQVGTLQPADQAAAVAAKLKDLNAGFDGAATHAVEGDAVVAFTYRGNLVKDIRPLAALKGLKRLECPCTPERSALDVERLKDLHPLKGLPLESLNVGLSDVERIAVLKGLPLKRLVVDSTRVKDLEPLRGSELEEFSANGCPLASLAPLEECRKLRHLDVQNTPIVDLKPLAAAPLVTALFVTTGVKDLSPVAKEPLETLSIVNCPQLKSLEPLAGLKSLRVLRASATPVADLKPLAGLPLVCLEISGTKVKSLGALEGMPLQRFACAATEVKDLAPLAKAAQLGHFDASSCKLLESLAPLAGMPLQECDASHTAIRAIQPLAGAPLRILNVRGTRVADLTPLKDSPVQTLNVSKSGVRSLGPLATCKQLGWLDASQLAIQDLSPLKGLPIRMLHISETAVTDLTPLFGAKIIALSAVKTPIKLEQLKEFPVNELQYEVKTAQHKAALRKIPTLAIINGKPVAEVLK